MWIENAIFLTGLLMPVYIEAIGNGYIRFEKMSTDPIYVHVNLSLEEPLGAVSFILSNGTTSKTRELNATDTVMVANKRGYTWPEFGDISLEVGGQTLNINGITNGALYIRVGDTVNITAELAGAIEFLILTPYVSSVGILDNCMTSKAFSLLRQFNTAGVYDFNVDGTNFVNGPTSNLTIQVFNRLNGYSILNSSQVIELGEPAPMTVSLSPEALTPMFDVKLVKNCSGSVEYLNFTLATSETVNITCSFNALGLYTANLTIRDYFGETMSRTLMFSVNEKCNVSVHSYYTIGENPKICLPMYGFTYEIDFGEGSNVSSSGPFNGEDIIIPSNLNYAPGTYTITITSNYFTTVKEELIVTYEQPLVQSELAKTGGVLVPPGIVEFQCRTDAGFAAPVYPPTNVTCRFYDTFETFPVVEVSPKAVNNTLWGRFSHTFATPGTHTVFLECSNMVSNINISTTFLARTFSALDIFVDVPYAILMNNSNPITLSLIFNLSHLGEPPQGLMYVISTNVGTPLTAAQMTSVINTVNFPTRDQNYIQIKLNYFSTENILQSYVKSGIMAITKTTPALKGIRGITNFTFDIECFLVDQTVAVTVIWDDGSMDDSLIFTAGPSPTTLPVVPKIQSVDHIFQDKKLVKPRLVAFSPIGTELLDLDDTIRILDGIADITISMDVQYSYKNSFSPFFTLVANNFPLYNVSCKYSYPTYAGKYTVSDYPSPSTQSSFTVPPSTPGYKRLTVSCKTDETEATASVDYKILCFQSARLFEGLHRTKTDAKKMFSDTPNLLTGRVSEPCVNTSTFAYHWTVENETGSSVTIKQPNTYRITPQDHIRSNGLFKLILNVTMPTITDEFIADSFWIDYIFPPLIATIAGGDQKIVGKGQLLELDGVSQSYDPNIGFGVADPALTFAWTCYVITDETLINGYLSPGYNGAEHRNQPSCPGTIFNGGRTTMDTSSMTINTWALIELTVTKDNRKTAYIQAVKIVRSPPPVGNILCELNCQPKLVPDDTTRMVVDVNCPSCQPSKLNYTWTVFKYSLSTNQDEEQPWSPRFSSSRYDDKFTAIEDAFDEGAIYKIQVEITHPDKPNGLSTIRFTTNFKPYGGSCNISPSEGQAFNDDFRVSCTGWKDEGLRPERGEAADATEPLTYRVIQHVGTKEVVVSDGVENITPTFKLQLCPSTTDFVCPVVVIISDTLFYGAQYTLQVKATSPIPVSGTVTANNTENYGEIATQVSAIDKLRKTYDNAFAGKTPTEQAIVASAFASVINDVPVAAPVVETFDVETVNNSQAASETLITSLKAEDPVTEKLSEALEDVVTKSTSSVSSAIKNGTLQTLDILKFARSVATSVPNPDIVTEKSQRDVSNTALKLSTILVENSAKSLKQNDILDTLNGLQALQDNLINIGSPDIADLDELPVEEIEDESGFNPQELEYFKTFKVKKKQISARKRKRLANDNIEKNDKMWNNSFTILDKYTTTDKPVTVTSKTFKINFQRASVRDVLKTQQNTTEFKDGVITSVEGIPEPDDAEIQVRTVILKKNIYIQGTNSARVKGPIVKASLRVGDKGIVNPNKIKIAFKDPIPPKYAKVVPKFIDGDASKLFYQRSLYRNEKEYLCLGIQPEIQAVSYDWFWRSLLPPTDTEYDFKETNVPRGSDGLTFVACLKPGKIKRKGVIYLGLRPYVKDDDGITVSRKRRSADNTTSNSTEILTSPFDISFQSFSCLTWAGQLQDWQDGKCEAERDVLRGVTTCRCPGNTGGVMSIAAFVPPNSIDFSTVFSKFDIISQGAVLGTIVTVVIIGILLALWGRWRDLFDVLEWGVTLLEDNCRDDQYYYLITVYTSFVREGSTTSNVSFDIYGEKNNTDVRKLSDGVRKGFKAGSVMHFLMAVPEPLGNLQYLRIWHDNAGTGKYASWSLNRVEVVDIQTDDSFVFLCNKWFSIEEGVIDRVLPVGGAENIQNFKGLFLEHARNHLSDEHVWVSILFRPVKSNFSRVARVACGVTLLFLCMISNAMFFENGDNKDRQRSSSIELGPIKFNPSQVYISLVSAILTAIPVYAIMTVFRKSKPKPWTKRTKQIPQWLPKCMREKLIFSQKLEEILVIPDNLAINDASLPSWGVYIGWFLAFVASFVSCFFIMLYSIEWGKDMSEEWLTTFILSFLQSLLCVDPFKVLVIAFIAGLLLKSPKITRPTHYDLNEISEFTSRHGKIKIERQRISTHQPTIGEDFTHIKAQRLRDNQMKNVIKDLILNILFLFLLCCILYSNRDTRSYNLHTYITDNFLDPPKPYRKYEKVIQSSHYFEWLNRTALPSLFPEEDYRGIRMTATERLFSYNSANVKVGPPRLRQVRARAGNCSYPYIGHTTCIPVYDVIQEDTDDYCPKWTPQPCSDAEESTLTIDAWKFTSTDSIWGSPIAGLLSLYGGGGYIADMDINKIVAQESLQEAFENHWIDRQTRAVFFEFTLYNTDINMFVYVSILTEFPETGGVVTYKNIFPFRSSQHVGTMGKFILICEIVAMLYIVVSVVIIGIRFTKQKWLFFTKFWNLVEFFTVAVSVIAIVFYILRDTYANQALAAFKENNRVFVNFYRVVIWDYAFVSVLGVLVTIATLRLLKAMAFTDITFKVFSVLRQTTKVFPGFATFILINLLSFSSAGYFMFGRTGAPYKSMITSMETMFIGLIGDTTFKKTNSEVAMDTLEIVLFSFFVICVTIILINLFMAILMDVMTRAQDDPPSKREVNMNVLSYIWDSVVRDIVDKPPDYTCLHPDIKDQTVKANEQVTSTAGLRNVSKLSDLIIQQLKNNPEFEKEMYIYEKKVVFSE